MVGLGLYQMALRPRDFAGHWFRGSAVQVATVLPAVDMMSNIRSLS